MKRILITGRDGQVGWELQRSLAPLGQVFSYDRNAFNLQQPDTIRKIIRDIKPDVIVNAAAYTAVDKAETDFDAANQINAIAPGIMAEEAKRLKALLIHYSTDYVFDGTASRPYLENDKVNPLNVYGRSKLDGEKAIQAIDGDYLIFRTSWVYGMRGKNFLLTMLRLGKEKDELKIVSDQIGAPTWSRMIAEATSSALKSYPKHGHDSDVRGIYNLTSSGQTSWFGFAESIFDLYQDQKVPKLYKITTADYPLPAARPQFSVLSNEKLFKTFQIAMPDWKDALRLCLSR